MHERITREVEMLISPGLFMFHDDSLRGFFPCINSRN